MTTRYRRLLLLPSAITFGFLLLSFVSTVCARSLFDSWTIDNGLPQNSVYSILQTRDGYLWFTTLNGLVRYDGAGFTVFDKSNSPGINSNRFTTLLEDKEGSLWIGTEENGLTKYKNGVFTTYTTNADALYNKIFAIQEEQDGSLWLLTEGGLARWQDEILTPYSSQGRLQLGIKFDQKVFVKDIQRNGGTAFADAAGLHVIEDGHLTTLAVGDGLSSLKINSLYKDSRGDLWIGTEDAGLNRLRDGKFTVYTTKDGLPSDHIQISAVCEDRRGNLWFAVGLGLYRLKEGALTHYTLADGLSGDLVQNIYEDAEGSIWVGTADGGINRFREEAIKAYSKNDGLFADNTYPIYEDSSGAVWIGTWPGLNKYEGGKFTHYTKADGLSSETVTALQEDQEGNLWVGTYGGGVNRFRDGRFTQLEGLTGTEAGGVLVIHQDRNGTLWFGTTAGLFKYQNKVLRHFTMNDGLPHPQVIALHEDEAGALWLGTRGGLARLKDDTFTVYTEKDGLSGNHVRSFYEDREGILWIGTYDGGLNRFKDGRFTRYTMREGLFDNGVFQILDDGRGNFWMSSNRGVYRVRREELEDFAAGQIRSITSIGYGRSDGMLNAECNGGSQPAGTNTRDGRLWFPTQQGVVVIDPKAIHTNPLPPPVLIQEVSLDNQRAEIGAGGQLLVEPGETRFEISYAGLSFIKPEQVRFKYKLEGLDKDWVEAGGRRTANYSYVPPGDYTFRVIAANSDGLWNTDGAAIRVVVKPPFWRTWWFVFLAIAGFGAMLVVAFQFRVTQLKKAQAVQEAFSRQLLDSQERERQRIAAELHDGLGQSLLIIKNRIFLALSQMDDREATEEQLDEISSSASHAIEEVREIAYNLRPYQLERFGLTKTLQAILMQASRVCAISFTSELEAIDDLFSKQAETSIYRIVQEAVNNIIKHSQATEANLMIRAEGNKMILRIQDNGRGITPIKETDGALGRGGFGLIGMSERVRILGGTYSIESAPGSGTTINIKLTNSGDNHEK